MYEYFGIGSATSAVTCLSILPLSVFSPSSCPLFSLSTSLTAAAQPCNQLIVHEGARTKAGKFRLTRQRGPEPIVGALGLSWGLMACDRLFLTDSVTNFSILDGIFELSALVTQLRAMTQLTSRLFEDNPFNSEASKQGGLTT